MEAEAAIAQEASLKKHDAIVAKLRAIRESKKAEEDRKIKLEALQKEQHEERARELEELRRRKAEENKILQERQEKEEAQMRAEQERLEKEKKDADARQKEITRKAEEEKKRKDEKAAQWAEYEAKFQAAEEEAEAQQAESKRQWEKEEAERKLEETEKNIKQQAEKELAQAIGDNLTEAYLSLGESHSEERLKFTPAIARLFPVVSKVEMGQELTLKERAEWEKIKQGWQEFKQNEEIREAEEDATLSDMLSNLPH